MADYTLNNEWSDIDAVAAAYKAGALVESRKLYAPTDRDILPVSAKSDGSLWSRSSAVYSFNSMSEYDEATGEDPEKIKNGDHVWIKSTGLNNANVYTLYLYFQYGLNKAVEIVSNASTGSGESDDTGKGAVIWYTKVGPSGKIFVISNLTGPAGAIPAPGHMIISDYTGRGYFITAVDNNAATIADYSVQVTGVDGGYYMIQTQKIDANTLRIRFTASKAGMQEIEDQYITLPKGPAGADAVIWYTNGGPSGNLFPVQTLIGPEGATPAPGQMIISKYTGLAYFITEIDGDAAVFGDYTVQVKPNTSETVSAVIAALPVYGGETQ